MTPPKTFIESEKELFDTEFPMLVGIKITANYEKDTEKAAPLNDYCEHIEEKLKNFISQSHLRLLGRILREIPKIEIGESSADVDQINYNNGEATAYTKLRNTITSITEEYEK